jgi:hypothetical protein
MTAAATKKSANAVAAKAKEYYEAVGCDFGAVDWSRLVGAGALIGRDAALAAATKPVVRPNGISGTLAGISGHFRMDYSEVADPWGYGLFDSIVSGGQRFFCPLFLAGAAKA